MNDGGGNGLGGTTCGSDEELECFVGFVDGIAFLSDINANEERSIRYIRRLRAVESCTARTLPEP